MDVLDSKLGIFLHIYNVWNKLKIAINNRIVNISQSKIIVYQYFNK